MNFEEVDGSSGEGGGQILRSAAAFSAILNRPVRVSKVRAGRETPGLKKQHVASLRVLAAAFGGELTGNFEGSQEVTFAPGGGALAELAVDTGSAASVTLILQAVVPAMALSGRDFAMDLVGGTDVPWSPTFDYVTEVLRPALSSVGVDFEAEANTRGYYPKGGGKVRVRVWACKSMRPLVLEEAPEGLGVSITSRCAGLPASVAERQLSAAESVVSSVGMEVKGKVVSVERSVSPGTSILVRSGSPGSFIGSDSIGARGKPAEEVGKEAGDGFVRSVRSGACVDINLADMVLPLLCFASGPSRVRVPSVSPHLETGLKLAKQFTGCSYSFETAASNTVVNVLPGLRN